MSLFSKLYNPWAAGLVHPCSAHLRQLTSEEPLGCQGALQVDRCPSLLWARPSLDRGEIRTVREGQTVVFINCMDAVKEKLAGPIRDALNELGYRAVIVMDEPLLRGSFDPESKVNAYIEASDAFVALCTADTRVPGGTAQNIIDEIGRARSLPGLREVVCILKEITVTLPSNINPVWESLVRDNPDSALGVIRRQLDAWGVVPTVGRRTPATVSSLPETVLEDLFAGVGLGDHDKAEMRLRHLFQQVGKADQARLAQAIFEYAIAHPDDGVDIHVVTSFLEACARLDLSLVELPWIERLAASPVVQHRMSAAIMLWERAETDPGTVPIDLVARLARPASEDWYVFSPALAAAKQLALTRRSALEVILDLGRSLGADDREYAVRLLRDLADVDPLIVPVDAVQRLARDSDPSVSEAAAELLPRLTSIPESERRVR